MKLLELEIILIEQQSESFIWFSGGKKKLQYFYFLC